VKSREWNCLLLFRMVRGDFPGFSEGSGGHERALAYSLNGCSVCNLPLFFFGIVRGDSFPDRTPEASTSQQFFRRHGEMLTLQCVQETGSIVALKEQGWGTESNRRRQPLPHARNWRMAYRGRKSGFPDAISQGSGGVTSTPSTAANCCARTLGQFENRVGVRQNARSIIYTYFTFDAK